MHFEIAHEFDIPLDALELAVISPELVHNLAPRLKTLKFGIESIVQQSHELRDERLKRVWRFQANVKVPLFAKYLTREMSAWDEVLSYDLKRHESTWTIRPNIRSEWQKYFSSHGTYRIVSLGDGRARRIVTGDLTVRVPSFVRFVAERMIVGEVKKSFEVEAETLREMATLS